uniref:hypothetical protein n=1 Tax=Paenibacillus sp. IHBB 10380 TaxID=1566358 RepID=UPI000A4628DC|nr:hypothetical protein [Paenibacillus sp. IHBB 10380]
MLRKDLLPRLQKYERYQETLGSRNSFSKTDVDATFMRMKEVHMRNGQLKPGYNVRSGQKINLLWDTVFTKDLRILVVLNRIWRR